MRIGMRASRGERPRSRAAEQRNEIAPLHRADSKPKDDGTIAGQGRASQQKRPAHVSYGSNCVGGDPSGRLAYVRFAPESRQIADISSCPLRADCSLIPSFGVKLSAIILAGPTVLSAVGASALRMMA